MLLLKDGEELNPLLPLCQKLLLEGRFLGMDIVKYLKAPLTYSGPTQLIPFLEIERYKGRSLSDRSVEASDR